MLAVCATARDGHACMCMQTMHALPLRQVKRLAVHCHGSTVLRRTFERLMLHWALRWHRRAESGRWCV